MIDVYGLGVTGWNGTSQISSDTIALPSPQSDISGIAVDASGNLWVGEGSSVSAYVPGTTRPIAGQVITTRDTPVGVAFDAAGQL